MLLQPGCLSFAPAPTGLVGECDAVRVGIAVLLERGEGASQHTLPEVSPAHRRSQQELRHEESGSGDLALGFEWARLSYMHSARPMGTP